MWVCVRYALCVMRYVRAFMRYARCRWLMSEEEIFLTPRRLYGFLYPATAPTLTLSC